MSTPLRVLLVEDNSGDAELVLRELRRAGFDPDWRRVDDETAFRSGLAENPEIVLSDFDLPQFNGLRALEILVESGKDLPFILISGTIGEDTAVEAMKLGASDYLLKDRLTRLGVAVGGALHEARLRQARRQADEELHLFRALVDQSEDGFEVIDPASGRFLDVNEKGCQRLGYTRAEFCGLPVWEVDAHVRKENWPELVKRLREEKSIALKTTHRRKDGSTFPVELRLKLVELHRDYVVASGRDITESERSAASLRESEERFRQLADNINEVFWMTDPTTSRVLYVSPAYETVWQRSCESLYAAGDGWVDHIHADDRGRGVAAMRRQAEGGYAEVYRVVRPGGDVRWVRDRAFPVKDGEGRVHRIVGTVEDVTENRQLQDQFHQAQKMEAIGTLAGGIAHDFNNILTGIRGYTELMRLNAHASPQAKDQLMEGLIAGCDRAASLVRQIMTFSRPQAHQHIRLNLAVAVEEPLKLLRATLPANVEIKTELGQDLPEVSADPTQIHQVLMNLCTNAAHAMKENGGALLVRLARRELGAGGEQVAGLEAGAYVRLSVEDTGCGIPAKTLGRIFDPFFTTKPPGEGTGLGLAVVHGIMECHRGRVLVESSPGKGTKFDLYFPEAVAGGGATEAHGDEEVPRGSGQRLLVVDDEPAITETCRLLLQQLGYRVETSANAAEARGLIARDPGRVDLVITDLTMPGSSGLELSRFLRGLRPELPVILMTGFSPALAQGQAREAGVSELMIKPMTRRQLGVCVHRVLQRRQESEGGEAATE